MSYVLNSYLNGDRYTQIPLTNHAAPYPSSLTPNQRISVNRILSYQERHYPKLPLPVFLKIDDLAFLEWNSSHYITFYETGSFACFPQVNPLFPSTLDAFFLVLDADGV